MGIGIYCWTPKPWSGNASLLSFSPVSLRRCCSYSLSKHRTPSKRRQMSPRTLAAIDCRGSAKSNSPCPSVVSLTGDQGRKKGPTEGPIKTKVSRARRKQTSTSYPLRFSLLRFSVSSLLFASFLFLKEETTMSGDVVRGGGKPLWKHDLRCEISPRPSLAPSCPVGQDERSSLTSQATTTPPRCLREIS